jgi:cobalt-zinc-cadmium efflux system outer membrane protein
MSAFIFRQVSLIAASALIIVTTSGAQEAQLSLADALARAAERNPTLLAHAYAERSAEALVEQAALRPNPTLDVEAEQFAGTGAMRGVRGLEATVQARQVLERGGKREKRVAVASRDRDSAAREYAMRRTEVLAATAVAYIETLTAQQRVVLANEPVRLAREILASAEQRVQAGAGSPAESARARAAVATAQGELGRAQADLVAARTRLAATWGGSAGDVAAVAGTLLMPEALPSDASLLEKLGGHPRVAHQKAIVEARRATLGLERARTAQDITVGGGVRFIREGSDAGFVAGVSVPLPVRNRNQGTIRAARENLAGAEQMVRAIETDLRAEFITAWQQASAAHAAAQNLRREALPATEQANAVVRRAFQQGELPLIDVLDAQREVIALRRELLELETAFAVAYVRAEALADTTFPAAAALFSSK